MGVLKEFKNIPLIAAAVFACVVSATVFGQTYRRETATSTIEIIYGAPSPAPEPAIDEEYITIEVPDAQVIFTPYPEEKKETRAQSPHPEPPFWVFDASAAVEGFTLLDPVSGPGGGLVVVGYAENMREHVVLMFDPHGNLLWSKWLNLSGRIVRPMMNNDGSVSLLSVGSEFYRFGAGGGLEAHVVYGYSYGHYITGSNGIIYAHLRDNPNELHAIGADGGVIWKGRCGAGGKYPHVQLEKDGSAVLFTAGGQACRLAFENGRDMREAFDSRMLNGTTFGEYGGVAALYGINEEARVKRLNLTDSASQWITEPMPGAGKILTLSDGGFLVVAVTPGGTEIIRLAGDSGKEEWRVHAGLADARVFDAEGVIYVSGYDAEGVYRVAGFGPDGGKRWTRAGFRARALETVDGAGRFIMRHPDRIAVLDRDGEKFVNWKTAGAETALISSPGGDFYFWPGGDGKFYGLEADFASGLSPLADVEKMDVGKIFSAGVAGKAAVFEPPYDRRWDGSISLVNCSEAEIPAGTATIGTIDVRLESGKSYIFAMKKARGFRLDDPRGRQIVSNVSLSNRARALAGSPESGIRSGGSEIAAFSGVPATGLYSFIYEVEERPATIEFCLYEWEKPDPFGTR